MTDTTRRAILKTSSGFVLIFISMVLLSCQPGVKEEEISKLNTKNAELVRNLVVQQRQIHLQQTKADSLMTIIHNQEDQLSEMSHKTTVLSADEKSLRELVFQMHKSWKELASKKDPQLILDYFLPRFMANQISIATEDKGHLAAFTELDYKNFLDDVISRKEFRVEFGNVRFLDVTVKDGEYFNVAYKCQMHQYVNDVLSQSSKVMVTMTGRKITDTWKIANYSVVSFEYSERP